MEHFWWSLKYEHVYLYAYDDLRVARQGIGAYIESSTTTLNGGTTAWRSSGPFRLTNSAYRSPHCRPRFLLTGSLASHLHRRGNT